MYYIVLFFVLRTVVFRVVVVLKNLAITAKKIHCEKLIKSIESYLVYKIITNSAPKSGNAIIFITT